MGSPATRLHYPRQVPVAHRSFLKDTPLHGRLNRFCEMCALADTEGKGLCGAKNRGKKKKVFGVELSLAE